MKTGMVLVAGGNDFLTGPLANAELFDPATGAFAATGSMSVARELFTATLLPNGKVLMGGGDNIQSVVGSSGSRSTGEVFDPSIGVFTGAVQMNAARQWHTATLRGDGSVLIVGGNHTVFTGGSTRAGVFPVTTATTESFDLGSGVFAADVSLATERTHHTATLLSDGKVLVVGGTRYTNTLPQRPPTAVTLSAAELLE